MHRGSVSKSPAESEGESGRSGQSGEIESKTGSRGEEGRPSRDKRAAGFSRRSWLLREEGISWRSRPCYADANPSEAAKVAGTPNTRMVTCPEVEARALRASRSRHERRYRARWARDRITSAVGGEATVGGDRLTSRCCCRVSCMQARRWSLRLQSRQSSGARPTRSGYNSRLTWRGFAVALPFH